MTKDDAQRDEELFSAALSLPLWERDAYLAGACQGDDALRSRLAALLRVVDGGSIQTGLPFGTRSELVGDRIDDYRLLEELGEGGCGVVYRAEQVAPIKRDVALKIIKLGMNSRAVMARFETERQVLALMDHPNIAKVLDAGSTASGRPYFVMELVRGIQITDYCNQVSLGIEGRVALFMQACRAIQHAHVKGIVHRDIKPSNVLVTLANGAPVVKVIDFGIAKATQGRLTEETILTAMEQFVGTLAYVSPEQTLPGGAGIDVRSDVYSLGVMLYELLSGCLPFDSPPTTASGMANLRERIREEEPLRPSERISRMSRDMLASAATDRGVQRSMLRQQISGDLDCIVLRCLEKEQAHRYQTVNELYADLQRHLRHESVAARPYRIAYRLSKLAHRRRAVVVTAAAIVAVVGTAAPGTISRIVDLTHANRLSQNLNNYLGSAAIYRSAQPAEAIAEGERTAPLGQLQPHIERIPPARASIHETLAASYRSLGDFANEQLHMKAALSIYEHSGNTRAVYQLNRSWATWLASQGRYAEAEARGYAVLKEEHTHRLIDPALAAVMGFVYLQEGKLAEARALLEPVLEQKRPTDIANGSADLALEVMKVLAAVYAAEGKHRQAERLARTVVLNDQRRFGPSFPETLRAVYVLADVYARSGQFSAASSVLVDGVYQQTQKRAWWKKCDCPEQPRAPIDPVRPIQAEQAIVLGILNLCGAPIPSPLTGCNCEPDFFDYPQRPNFNASLVMAD